MKGLLLTISIICFLVAFLIMGEGGDATTLILIGALAFFLYYKMKEKETKKNTEIKTAWDARCSGSKYNHFCDDTGIAIDVDKEVIHLINKDNQKTYPFSDIRSWEYKLLSGGGVVGGPGLAAIAANAQNLRDNRENSGFFVTVKDIDFPQWRIAFPRNDLEKTKTEMKRWMEIFQQYVNKD